MFHVPEFRHGHAELRGEEARHLSKVLRVERGQQYELSDNEQVWLGEVEAAHKDLVSFRLVERVAARPEPPPVALAVALIKFDKLEWVLEKATELGAARVVLVECDRSEKGLELAAVKRKERWERILIESAQQCRRPKLPLLEGPVRFAAALELEAEGRYFCDEAEPEADFVPAASAALLIGPEGGWTDRERERARAAGWRAVSLGGYILRAETAAIAALAVLSDRMNRK